MGRWCSLPEDGWGRVEIEQLKAQHLEGGFDRAVAHGGSVAGEDEVSGFAGDVIVNLICVACCECDVDRADGFFLCAAFRAGNAGD